MRPATALSIALRSDCRAWSALLCLLQASGVPPPDPASNLVRFLFEIRESLLCQFAVADGRLMLAEQGCSVSAARERRRSSSTARSRLTDSRRVCRSEDCLCQALSRARSSLSRSRNLLYSSCFLR